MLIDFFLLFYTSFYLLKYFFYKKIFFSNNYLNPKTDQFIRELLQTGYKLKKKLIYCTDQTYSTHLKCKLYWSSLSLYLFLFNIGQEFKPVKS